MKKLQYKRGTYNKPERMTKKIAFNLTAVENEKIMELSELLKMNYSAILREAFSMYYKSKEKISLKE